MQQIKRVFPLLQPDGLIIGWNVTLYLAEHSCYGPEAMVLLGLNGIESFCAEIE